MLQFVREDGDKAIIIRRLAAEVRLSLVSRKENALHWPSTPFCLNPTFRGFIHRARPKSHRIGPKSRVGQFNHDAADIFVREEVVPRELHVIEIALCVEKERIAAPTEEKTVIAAVRH